MNMYSIYICREHREREREKGGKRSKNYSREGEKQIREEEEEERGQRHTFIDSSFLVLNIQVYSICTHI